MTRNNERTAERLDPNRAMELRLDARFWCALLAVQNRFFREEMEDYNQKGRPKNHVFKDLQTLDCWLDVAVNLGCLDESDQ